MSEIPEILRLWFEFPPEVWPEGADDIVYAALQDDTLVLDARLDAAKLAGDISFINDGRARLLLDMALDERLPEKLRGQTAIALGPVLEITSQDIDDFPEELLITPETWEFLQEKLHSLFEDDRQPVSVRRMALEAAVRSSQEWQVEAVRNAYASDNKEWHLTAVFCMGYIEGFDKEILESLESEDPDILFHALQAAGNFEIREAWEEIRNILEDDTLDEETLAAAIYAASLVAPDECWDYIEPFESSASESIREAIEEAVANLELNELLENGIPSDEGDLEGEDLDDDEDFDDDEDPSKIN